MNIISKIFIITITINIAITITITEVVLHLEGPSAYPSNAAIAPTPSEFLFLFPSVTANETQLHPCGSELHLFSKAPTTALSTRITGFQVTSSRFQIYQIIPKG